MNELNIYTCFYRGKQISVEAHTTYEAQKYGATLLKAKKRYDVTVMLVAKADGVPVIHTAVD